MKVTYTGRHVELPANETTKLTAAFDKVSKMLDTSRGEVQAHVIVGHERLVNTVEITVPYHHHELVGHGSHTDLYAAFHEALVKLEGQAIKVREKARDSKRTPEPAL